jgi:hypothetical protein
MKKTFFLPGFGASLIGAAPHSEGESTGGSGTGTVNTNLL